MTTRRDFIRTGAAASGALLAGVRPDLAAFAAAEQLPRVAPLRILFLGGTGFLGPHGVRYAVARGHKVSIFTRGQRQAELPDGIEYLTGDRNGQLDALKGKTWDAVIDNSATDPEWVRQTTELLKGNVGMYSFTSSTGVYFPMRLAGIDETTPVWLSMKKPNANEYGVNKANCEQLVTDAFEEKGLCLRPHYIVGPGDTTDRFPHWPQRLARGGETMAPGKRTDPVQMIDVRDLTEFNIHQLEKGQGGTYIMSGPTTEQCTQERFLREAMAAINSTSQLVWVDDYAFLQANRVSFQVPWMRPVGGNAGTSLAKYDKAMAAGLTHRSIGDTVRDTLAWWPTREPETRRTTPPRFSWTAEREAEILAAWKARR